MSVKRYDFDCIASAYALGASLDTIESADGDYVLHSDYAALLARHKVLALIVADIKVHCGILGDHELRGHVLGLLTPIQTSKCFARAEVGPLLEEEK